LFTPASLYCILFFHLAFVLLLPLKHFVNLPLLFQ
jgi:hypothetical protein